jgi:hypothetical protein
MQGARARRGRGRGNFLLLRGLFGISNLTPRPSLQQCPARRYHCFRLRNDAASLDKNSEKNRRFPADFTPPRRVLCLINLMQIFFFLRVTAITAIEALLFDAALQQSHTSACKCRRRLAFNQPNSSLKLFSAGFSLILTPPISAANSSRSRRQK